MRKLLNIFVLALVVLTAACTEDPLKDIENSTDWQKERNILSILLEGQIGTPVIEREFDDAKISIYAKIENIADISKVEIKDIQFAYGASSENAIGSTLDFTNGKANISVLSGAGENLDWEVSLLPFNSDMEGTWYISEIGMYCDMFTWEDWGWEKYVAITDYLPELSPELDNTITFVVEGADASGNPFGSYDHASGGDGVYGNFGDSNKGWDFNSRLRTIPTGKGTWLRDFARNKVIITDENNKEIELDLELLTETNEVSLKAELAYLADDFNWTDTDWALEELSKMSNPMWYKMTKTRVIQSGNDITVIKVPEQKADPAFNFEEKYIGITIDMDILTDLTAVELLDFNISYMATTTVEVGDKLDFSSNSTTTIEITSEAGETAVWTIELKPYFKSIAGTWEVTAVKASYDFFSYEDWGYWGELDLVEENALPELSSEIGNRFVFTVENSNDNGLITGTFNHEAGDDGAYGEFTNTVQAWDFNERLRQFPKGEGTWAQNPADGTVVLTAGDKSITMVVEVNNDNIVMKAPLEYKIDQFSWDEWNTWDAIKQNYQIIAFLSNPLNYTLVEVK